MGKYLDFCISSKVAHEGHLQVHLAYIRPASNGTSFWSYQNILEIKFNITVDSWHPFTEDRAEKQIQKAPEEVKTI